MIFKNKKHNSDLYNILLNLSRKLYFYDKLKLKDTFETRIYLMFFHFSLILIIFKKKDVSFSQSNYDSLFYSIENNIRELGFGDVAVNKKMKELNKVFYDILLKISKKVDNFKVNKELVLKYFEYLKDTNDDKYKLFEQYITNFYHFCFELSPETMLKDVNKFKDY